MTLKDALDQEKFVIEDKEYTDNDLQAMSLDELETLRMQINKKIYGLSTIIKEKQVDYANGGKGAEKEWFTKHKTALWINQNVLAYVNYLIKKSRMNERKMSDYFMNEAKKILPREEFENILTKANLEMRNGGSI